MHVDDGNSSQNPDPPLLGGLLEVNASWNFRGGYIVKRVVGPLSYTFGKYRIDPPNRDGIEIVPSPNTRKDPPSFPNGEMSVVFTNLYNYWTTIGPGSNLRGADSEEEFIRQSTKTILAMKMMDVDIIAVCESQNGPTTAQDIVNKLNIAFEGAREYKSAALEAFDGTIGEDIIKVDIFFDSKKLDMIGSAILTDDDVDPAILSQSTTGRIFKGYSRVPLAGTFRLKSSSDSIITVVPNHYKSKGIRGNPPGLGDNDANDGAAGMLFILLKFA